MLIRLVRTYLEPYRSALLVVVVLQFIGTVAMLYLPSLNADIIDRGVVTGDTRTILRLGMVMLVVTLVQVACSIGAVWFSARNAMGFGRDVRSALFRRVGTFSAPGGPAVRRSVADHPRDQRRPAGADAGADGRDADGVRADHDGRGPGDGRARQCRTVLAGRRGRPRAGPPDRLHRQPDGAQLPEDAGADRRGQPRAAGADHRRPGGPRVRDRGGRDASFPRCQRGPHRGRRTGRPLAGRDVSGGDAGGQRRLGGGAVVRRPPGRGRADAGRRPDCVPRLPDADRDVGDDGDLHDDDDPALGGLRRPDHARCSTPTPP